MPKHEQLPDLLTSAQVAEMLGVDVATVNRRVRQGKLPITHKLPGNTGAYLFDRSAIEALLLDQSKSAS